MIHNLRHVIFVLAMIFTWPVQAIPPTPVDTDSDILKPGTKGYVLSCFSGTEPVRLDLEIIGVLRNPDPDSNAIIARVLTEPVKSDGIMAGMSGSPVFVNDQLIGAMSFAFPYATEAIGGITPIASMEELMTQLPETAHDSVRFNRERKSILTPPGDEMQMVPIRSPLFFSGIPDSSIDYLRTSVYSRDFFAQHIPVRGGVSGNGNLTAPVLKPGSPVGAILIDGDIKMAATGTVTDVRGNRVIAFGHAMMSLGSCDIPMAAAEIITHIPNVANSFKLANIGQPIGSFLIDAEPGVAGILGSTPRLIPVTMRVKSDRGEMKCYSFDVVDEPGHAGIFTAIGAGAALRYFGPGTGDFSYTLNATLTLEDYGDFQIRRVAGSGSNPHEEMFRAFAVIRELLENPIEPLRIQSIDVTVDLWEQIQFSQLESAELSSNRLRPGDTLQVRFSVKSYRNPSSRHVHKFVVPQHIDPGIYNIKILDSDTYRTFRSRKHVNPFFCRDMTSYLDQLREREPENLLHILLVHPSTDIVVGHTILPNSPPSLESVMQIPGSSAEIRPTESSILHSTIEFPNQISGQAEFTLDIIPN
jgi:SpoIVB peptidase S55